MKTTWTYSSLKRKPMMPFLTSEKEGWATGKGENYE